MNSSSRSARRHDWLRAVFFSGLVLVAITSDPASSHAQQVVISSPLQNIQDGFYEHIGFGMGYSNIGPRGGWFFDFNSMNGAVPPFGGWAGGGARFGFGLRNGNSRFNFNMVLAQGNTRSMTMVAPSITVPNGYGGSIFSGSVRPFVTGWVPIVGQGWSVQPVIPYRHSAAELREELRRINDPGEESTSPQAGRPQAPEPDLVIGGQERPPAVPRFSSSAERGDDSLAAIHRQLEQEDRKLLAEAYELIIEGQQAELAGKKGVARIYYRQAANRCQGELQKNLLRHCKYLKQQGSEQ
jgi:hypothetical protein